VDILKLSGFIAAKFHIQAKMAPDNYEARLLEMRDSASAVSTSRGSAGVSFWSSGISAS
jgi:hypothetical protein